MSNQFKNYVVVAKVTESSIITSFLLKPEDGPVPEFCPGEYLIFELPSAANGEPLRREYSISGLVDGALRVTIKREPAAPGYGPGAGSTYFHDHVSIGDQIRAAGPFGQFRLDCSTGRHVVLVSGGVGLTPMVAMARQLGSLSRTFTFIHACEDGSVHAMGDEIRALAKANPAMTTHFCYRLPRHEDRPGKDYDSTGFLTTGTIQGLLPLDEYDFYLCGPGPFMQALYDILNQLGVRDDRIRYEFFGPATLLRTRDKGTSLPPTSLSQSDAEVPTVHFAKSGLSVAWDPHAGNLLEFAEENGLMPDFSCRAGTCESCKTRVVSGEVDYLFEPFEKPGDDHVLICCSIPKGEIMLDL